MADQKEKGIEKVPLPTNVKPEAIENDLSEADLESVSGATHTCIPTFGPASRRKE